MSQMDVEAVADDWRKASRSVNNGACVEVGSASSRILVRDSVNPLGATIAYPPTAWQAFLSATKAGDSETVR